MSWAEVKKFLNKRPDKSLDEIIEDAVTEVIRKDSDSSHLAEVTVSAGNTTVLDIRGKGSIQHIVANIYIPAKGTGGIEIKIDGKTFATQTWTSNAASASAYSLHVINLRKTQGFDSDGLLKVFTSGGELTVFNGSGVSPIVCYSGEPITTTDKYLQIRLPKDLVFEESVVVTATNTIADTTTSTFRCWYLLDD